MSAINMEHAVLSCAMCLPVKMRLWISGTANRLSGMERSAVLLIAFLPLIENSLNPRSRSDSARGDLQKITDFEAEFWQTHFPGRQPGFDQSSRIWTGLPIRLSGINHLRVVCDTRLQRLCQALCALRQPVPTRIIRTRSMPLPRLTLLKFGRRTTPFNDPDWFDELKWDGFPCHRVH
jgi:hypothetical protein